MPKALKASSFMGENEGIASGSTSALAPSFIPDPIKAPSFIPDAPSGEFRAPSFIPDSPSPAKPPMTIQPGDFPNPLHVKSTTGTLTRPSNIPGVPPVMPLDGYTPEQRHAVDVGATARDLATIPSQVRPVVTGLMQSGLTTASLIGRGTDAAGITEGAGSELLQQSDVLHDARSPSA